MIEIAPSVLSADFTRLAEEVRRVDTAGADLIHVDVMDGRFVPNITIGPLIVRAIRRATERPLDVHLMIVEPERYVEDFARSGANMISVHVEASIHLHRTLDRIHELGCKAGIAVNPATPLASIEEALEFSDYILIMSVNPGFGGQKFIGSSLEKVRRLAGMIRHRGLDTRIEIDGGITTVNLSEVIGAGAQMIVAGSAIFSAPDAAEAVRRFRQIAESASVVSA
ncbi:MAG: ribulose-phosphate 3-epimerase [Acidobacteria bacterium]|nr:ribulose-phosphate 3-epimerase [Acidobacteriota bacterium]